MRVSNNKGFGFIELLLVVLVMGLLAAVSFPIFGNQIEKSREAADLANVRAAYAEIMVPVLTNNYESDCYNPIDKTFEKNVELVQTKGGWSISEDIIIGGISEDDDRHWFGEPNDSYNCRVIYSTVNNETYIVWDEFIYRIGYIYKLQDGNLVKEKVESNNTFTLPSIYKINNGYTFINLEEIGENSLIKNLDEYSYELEYFILSSDNKRIESSNSITLTKEGQIVDISSDKLLNGEEVLLVLQIKKIKNETLDLSDCELSKREVKSIVRLIDILNNY